MGMEIERKWLVSEEAVKRYILEDCDYRDICQGYLCASPVMRICKSKKKNGECHYILSYKGKGLLEREEYTLPLTEEAFEHLKAKIDGRLLTKRRYLLPYGEFCIELDIFKADLAGLIYAEVEFSSVEEAETFLPPEWFGKELTKEPGHTNADLALRAR